MRQKGAVKQQAAGQTAPDETEIAPSPFHKRQGMQAERVVDEMRDEKHGEDDAGDDVKARAIEEMSDRQDAFL
jgi:hypothetical protein